ncbi:DUF551 domain-containing protein [Morganella morganii]
MKMEWIKCSERMPGRYTNVMVRDKDGWVIDCFLLNQNLFIDLVFLIT